MKVNTEELIRQSDALRYTAFRLEALQEEVLQVKGFLETEVTGKKLETSLQNMAKTIGNQFRDLELLGSALEQISQMYEWCENEVTEEAQDSKFRMITGYRVIQLSKLDGEEHMENMLDWLAWDP